MLLRDVFIMVLMVAAVSIVMTGVMVDFTEAGYDFNTTSNFSSTYSKLSNVVSAKDTSESNLRTDRDIQITEEGSTSWIKSIGNSISMVINSLTYITGDGGLVDTASGDLGLNTENSWIKSIVIASFVVTITFMIASLWLRRPA